MSETHLEELAEWAWVYGFPRVFNLDQVTRYVTTGVGANPVAPFNRFSHAEHLATSADTLLDGSYHFHPDHPGVTTGTSGGIATAGSQRAAFRVAASSGLRRACAGTAPRGAGRRPR